VERRPLLGAAAAGIAGVAGCLGLSNPAESLGVPAGESDCPPTAADRVVCVPETDPGSASVALTADPRSAALPATFAFTLGNGSARTLSTNYYAWTLWKRVEDDWHHIVPAVAPQPLMRLDARSSHEWELTAEHELPADPGRDYASWESAGSIGGLGGGEYAFTTDGWFGDAEETVGFGVLFEVDAPELRLEPTARVTGSSRDDDTVTVRGDGLGEEENRAEFLLRRLDSGEDPRRVIPEQAAHDARLRNTLPYFETGVDRVRYVERGHTTGPPFGVGEPYTIRYRGELYEASTRELASA
jgi:hypothetical protein